jgi:hypothetical protein
MKVADTKVGALLVGALFVICCAGPLVIAAISSTALAAWFSNSLYVAIPATIIAAGIAVFWFWGRHIDAENCRQHEKKASNHE